MKSCKFVSGNQLKIQRVRQISLDGLVPDPFKIQYFDWFIPLVGDHLSTKAAIDQAAFIVLNQGQLSLVEQSTQVVSIQQH
jgi:hypothetical protein